MGDRLLGHSMCQISTSAEATCSPAMESDFILFFLALGCSSLAQMWSGEVCVSCSPPTLRELGKKRAAPI